MNWDSRLWRNVDYFSLLLVGLLLGVGLPVIASAVRARGWAPGHYLLYQATAAALGAGLMVLLALIDYNEFPIVSRWLYFLNLVMLALVRVPHLGLEVNGAYRWIQFGPVQIQPSEPAKLILLITLANFLAHQMAGRERLDRWSDLLPPFLHVLPAAALVMLQPDLGTSLVMFAMLGAMLYMAGVPGLRLLFILLVAVGLVSGLVFASLHGVKVPLLKYQIQRLTTFVNINADPTKDRWQLDQGQIAIGSGGLWGKGLNKGTQNQFGFLSEPNTDWIFSVWGEEIGFVGSAALLLTYLILLARLVGIAIAAKDHFGLLLVTGVVAMFGFHVVENVGMVLGVMPAAGIPLPFISYSPSSVVTSLAAIGLALNVYMRRQTIMF